MATFKERLTNVWYALLAVAGGGLLTYLYGVVIDGLNHRH